MDKSTDAYWNVEPPDHHGDYLVTIEDGRGERFVVVSYWDGEQWIHYNESDQVFRKIVIAWQPLGYPYTIGEQIRKPTCRECGHVKK
jgi:hypothetical protein